MDFGHLLQNGFRLTGLFPFSPDQLESVTAGKSMAASSQPTTSDEAQLLAIRNYLRSQNVDEDIIKRTLEDILLKKKGVSRTDIFASELASLIHSSGHLVVGKDAVDSRLTTKELGQILLESDFQAQLDMRTSKKRGKVLKPASSAPKKPAAKLDAQRKHCD